MFKSNTALFVRRLFSVLALTVFGASSLWAEDVFVTAFKGTSANSADNTPCPPSCVSGTASATGASGPSTASPIPVIPAAGRRMRMGTGAGCAWAVTPTDTVLTPFTGGTTYTFTSLQHTPGMYKIYVTKASTSQSPDILVNMTCASTDGALYDASSNAAPSGVNNINAFQSGQTAAQNAWGLVGYISNNVASPTVTFTYASGTLASTTRWYMDAVRFQFVGDPCSDIYAAQPSVGGPLAAGQDYVNVSGVLAGATNITVYANGSTVIGSTNNPAGFAAGTVQVTNVTALVKGDGISATQSKTNTAGGPCTSTQGAASIVGGGPNPAIKVFLSCWKNPTNAGPAGVNMANPVANSNPYVLKATQITFNSAPQGGVELQPGQCWQSVTFQDRGIDPARDLNSGSAVTNLDAFAALDGIIFAMDASDNGPYEIYVDQIVNGDTVIENFEGYATGSTNTFATPNLAATPSAGGYLPGAPNSSLIRTNYSYDGTNSCRMNWQWIDNSNTRWSHVQANAPTGKHYPQLDTTKPTTVRFLVLPVGTTTAHKFNGTVSAITNGPALVYPGGTATVGVTVTGPGSYTYQWSENGGAIGGATDQTYTNPSLPGPGSISYQVDVSDGTCTEVRQTTFSISAPLPVITNQPISALVNVGNPAPPFVVAGAHPSGLPLTYQWEFFGNSWTNTPTAISATDASLGTGSGITSAQLTDSGYYDVIVANTYGSVTSSPVSLQVVAADVVIGNGSGLRGDYYNNASYATPQPATGVAYPGSPVITRVDPTINYLWGNGSPDPAINPDFFAVRWYGQIQAPLADTYTITARTDDGVRVWVDNTLVIDSWAIQGPTDRSGTIALDTAKHNILMEYFERQVGASAQLSWSNSTGTIVESLVPVQQLFPRASYTKPVIALTSPSNGSSTSGAVSLAANVTTNEGMVAYVAFYTNQTILATVTNPPYTYNWSSPPAGTFGISAQVLYNASTSGGNPSSFAVSGTNSVTVIPVVSGSITGIVYGNPVTISGTGTVGHAFVLVSSTNVAAALNTWTREQTNTAGTGSYSFNVTPGGEASKFFRVQTQ